MTWRVEQADCIDAMRAMDEASVDAIVTDPPAGISFMAKSWDGNKGGRDAWVEWLAEVMRECLRVAKPGAHAFVWALPRTSHWTGWAIEKAGWEVRDRIAHHFGSGFPKSLNLGDGRGTALKPATEDWWLCRKPLIGTVAANVQAHGTGALNIDGCRIEGEPRATGTVNPHAESGVNGIYGSDPRTDRQQRYDANLPAGRWPANVALSHLPECTYSTRHEDGHWTYGCAPGCPVAELDRQSGESVSRPGNPRLSANAVFGTKTGADAWVNDGTSEYGDTGGASRFFYVAKASRAERNAGLDGFALMDAPGSKRSAPAEGRDSALGKPRQNGHPTVKPIDLMRWLVRLVTPPDGTVLDPFVGSGTTGCAAVLEGFDFVGIEREAEYAEIARARIEWWAQHKGRDADEVLAVTRRSESARREHEDRGQLGLL